MLFKVVKVVKNREGEVIRIPLAMHCNELEVIGNVTDTLAQGDDLPFYSLIGIEIKEVSNGSNELAW